MRVVIVNLCHDPRFASAEDVLVGYQSLTGWADSLAATGCSVVVVQGSSHETTIERRSVRYEFVAGPFDPLLDRRRLPWRLVRAVARCRPEVVHVNGLLYPLQIRLLRWMLPSSCVIVVQHHGSEPRTGLGGWLQRACLKSVDGFIFAGSELASEFEAAGMVRPDQPVFEIMESSTDFQMLDRVGARRETGMAGSPIFFWAGHLDANKDPITVLTAFDTVVRELNEARLYMAYRSPELLPEVRELIEASEYLRDAVVLLGELDREQMQAYLSSTDYFVQGSHREGSGYAVAEALACGAVPVVTDIPSFRFMTDCASVGGLWQAGDACDLTRTILRVVNDACPDNRQRARALFDRRLSFQVIGEAAQQAYGQFLEWREVEISESTCDVERDD